MLWMHDSPNLSKTPNAYNRKPKNNYERWNDCFWSNSSNKTLLRNKVNAVLPPPSNLSLYLIKHRPPKFRDCARRFSQTCLAISNLCWNKRIANRLIKNSYQSERSKHYMAMTIKGIRRAQSSHITDFWQKIPSASNAVFLIRQHAWATLFVLVFQTLKLANWLFCLNLLWLGTHCSPISFIFSLKFFTNFLTFFLLWMHDRSNIARTPTTYNHTAKNNYERWKDCFLSKISNDTHLWNKVKTPLPPPSNFCLHCIKHRPPIFRESWHKAHSNLSCYLNFAFKPTQS
jgi:hypothetical protein